MLGVSGAGRTNLHLECAVAGEGTAHCGLGWSKADLAYCTAGVCEMRARIKPDKGPRGAGAIAGRGQGPAVPVGHDRCPSARIRGEPCLAEFGPGRGGLRERALRASLAQSWRARGHGHGPMGRVALERGAEEICTWEVEGACAFRPKGAYKRCPALLRGWKGICDVNRD